MWCHSKQHLACSWQWRRHNNSSNDSACPGICLISNHIMQNWHNIANVVNDNLICAHLKTYYDRVTLDYIHWASKTYHILLNNLQKNYDFLLQFRLFISWMSDIHFNLLEVCIWKKCTCSGVWSKLCLNHLYTLTIMYPRLRLSLEKSSTHPCPPVWKLPPVLWQNTDFSAQNNPFCNKTTTFQSKMNPFLL